MRSFSRMVLWGGLVATLGIGTAPAQLFNEVLRASVSNVPTDMFGCGDGLAPCNLQYRLYTVGGAGVEVNGPINPVSGIPRYGATKQRYLSAGQLSGNYTANAPGQEFYAAWDGVTSAAAASHAGWYGVQSQKLSFGEIGNSQTFNCLPVIAQEACFRALSPLNSVNSTTRGDGSALANVGGISPIPCPRIVSNNLDSIDLSWEQANGFTTNDGASNPIVGTKLVVKLDQTSSPNEAGLASAGVVASYPRTTTSANIPRSHPALASGTAFVFANKVSYAAGLESVYHSCNSAATGVCVDDPIGDAPSSVDIERVCAEVRTHLGVRYVVLTYDIVGDQPGLARHEKITFTGQMTAQGGGITTARVDARALNATKSALLGEPVVMRYDASNFDPPLFADFSNHDDSLGQIEFVINADALLAKVGSTSVDLVGRVKIPGAEDLISMSFSFAP